MKKLPPGTRIEVTVYISIYGERSPLVGTTILTGDEGRQIEFLKASDGAQRAAAATLERIWPRSKPEGKKEGS